ncbi:hypothetical protein TTHERM_00071050 (macronuclear) [Tetrahymena thermophila SB210]|uniref:Uncharacterized protein n=1 Tax=Tetrahymena thermophila (strain SB210) TaxID=312017 RepID=I7MDH5_TETTS|nr:hypothetical protein TTHERM_00071050 [Tetrahymena thermophila SB210]EAR87598.1 hypothetical protein TTHERM_00071050 [Tetrahymena thermophila SB210]|eukprot:XP_001007843.1 hypothetical protein TTHERM_00071050 [Tetrahymena thermophila SB210]
MSFPKSFGFYEDLKNFTLCITQKSNNQVGFISNALQIHPTIKSCGDNIVNISFSHQYGGEITSFTLQYQKKNPAVELEVKSINGVNNINSNVVFHQEVKTINSTQIYTNSLNYYSVNHFFNINQEKDSFSINFQIESPNQRTDYSYTFYLGQFNALPLKQQQQQQIDLIVKHEQEDENLKRLSQSPLNDHNHNQNDEALSTKSHSPIQEETLYGHYCIPQVIPTTTVTTQTRTTIQDQMKIEDNVETSFARQRKGSKVSSSSNFNNNSEESQSTEFQNNKKSKFDKKNVVKNFVKAFDSFFLDSHNDQLVMNIAQIQSRDQLKKYKFAYEKLEKSMKYNNKMIIAIIYSEYKDIFQHFLQTEADKWIQNSSVFDKEAHRAILKDYIRAAENPRDIPKIVNLRIRNRDANCKLNL